MIKKPYKLSEQQFLDKYGKDNSSRALIRYYFERRKTSGKASGIAAAIAGGLGTVVGLAVLSLPGVYSIEVLLVVVLLGTLAATSALISLFSIVIWLKTSRKGLLKLLRNYNAGKKIPKRITWRPLFKKFLEEEKNRK